MAAFMLALGGPAAAQENAAERALSTGLAGQHAGTVAIKERGEQTPILGAAVPCTDNAAGDYPCKEIDLLAFLPISAIGGEPGIQLNDIWGWTDPDTGKEYALVGRTDGVSFVDVSDPVSPVYVGTLPRTDSTAVRPWRDLKVYANHVFVVADNAGAHGMQVFDLTQLRGVIGSPVTFTETALYDAFDSAHNIAINEETGFAYVVGGNTCGGGMHMIDIHNPLAPASAGCAADTTTGFHHTGYTHDVQCVVYHGPDAEHQGREICFGSNENAVSVTDVTDKAAPAYLSTGTYPDRAYVHQGWLTEDHRYFLQDDELDEIRGYTDVTRTIIWDVSDLDDPRVLREFFFDTPAIDHNLYVVGERVYEANYASGLRVLDVSDIANPKEVAYFDTFPESDLAVFQGAWSSYPFFSSGTIVVSSIGEGLFVLRLSATDVGVEEDGVPQQAVLAPVYPNPFNPETTLTLTLAQAQPVRLAVCDLLGREVALLHEGMLSAGEHAFRFQAQDLPSGLYVVRASGPTFRAARTITLAK